MAHDIWQDKAMKHFYSLLALLSCAAVGTAFDYLPGKAPDKYGIFTPAQIQTERDNGYRPTSIDFAGSTGGVKFAVAFVSNSGSYNKPNLFKFAQTSQGVIDTVNQGWTVVDIRSEEHTSELQSHHDLVCRLLLEKKKKKPRKHAHE